ncbi:MAG: hypothetical protein IT440_08480 [Phycisphaeraceae bacterium]|nr:hypothetical protein [Phycisphaeraceae bacterium]
MNRRDAHMLSGVSGIAEGAPWTLALALCLPLLTGAAALADEIKFNGFWIKDVEIQTIAEGKVIYTSRGSEVRQPLTRLEGMRMATYPAVGETFDALDKKDDEAALRAISQIVDRAREKWLVNWARSVKVMLLDRLRKPVESVGEYLRLVSDGAEASLLGAPPMTSLAAATAGQKQQMSQRLQQALDGSAKGTVAAPLIQKMLQLLATPADDPGSASSSGDNVAEATPAPAASPATTTVTAAPAPGSAAAPLAIAKTAEPLTSAIPLSSALDAQDEITRMLAQGKYREALDAANQRLAGNDTRLAMRLYQKGVAQLYLAEKSGDRKDYLDAAISFMRSQVYFPKSSFAGPCLIEAGCCHQKAGLNADAARLWRQAQLIVDADTDPSMAARLDSFLGAAGAGEPDAKPEESNVKP